jgi:3-methyladenine DNA glycosylase AlkD
MLAFARAELSQRADPARAAGAQAYMKSEMPFHGVGAKGTREAARAVLARFPLADARAWRAAILALWRGAAFREERYVAIEILKAPRYHEFLDLDALPVMEEMISHGAWWDLVDAVATRPLGELLARQPAAMRRTLRAWSRAESLWLRRAAILAQLNFKERTDRALLRRLIAPSLPSREFFLAKAIGWALRQFARTDPQWVRAYVEEHRARLAPLSIREALRHVGGAEVRSEAAPPARREPRAKRARPRRRSTPK